MTLQTSFSIIIPIFNSWKDATIALKSVLIASSQFDVEIIAVDDCSDNFTGQAAFIDYANQNKVKILKTEKNFGPGIARNIGMAEAEKDYIAFLDSDDELKENYFSIISSAICEKGNPDVIGFDYELVGARPDLNVNRYDLELMNNNIFESYVAHKCDGSVILATYRRQFLSNNSLEFEEGIFEDLLFMAKVYAHATNVVPLPQSIYIKNTTKGSITSNIDENKALTYLQNWNKVCELAKDKFVPDNVISEGKAVAAISRLREIIRHSDDQNGGKILKVLLQYCIEEKLRIQTRSYFQFILKEINLKFASLNDIARLSNSEVFQELSRLFNGYLSCKDLEGSIFLRSAEVRACCKRFFVNNHRKGDISLAEYDGSVGQMIDESFTYREQLIRKINAGAQSECSGCPFIQRFTGPINKKRKLNYISIENHSICNLRCSYCSPEYYSGTKETYPVSKVFNKLISDNRLGTSVNTIWGGGEPTIGPNFTKALEVQESHNDVFHKFLTNSVKFRPEIAALMKQNKAQVISSIDSYSKESFIRIRGRNKFNEVFSNIAHYEKVNSELTTIKYIITAENSDNNGLNSFVSEIARRELHNCNFQISCDFKEESIERKLIEAACRLFCKLREQGCSYIYFDDLIAARLNLIKTFSLDQGRFQKYLFSNFNRQIDIFGTGQHALNLFERFELIPIHKVSRFLNTPNHLTSSTFLGKPNVSIKDITDIQAVFIASVHDFARIRQLLPSHTIKSLIPL